MQRIVLVTRYRHLKEALWSDEIVPKPHQNTIKTALVHARPVAVREMAVRFIENFAIQKAVV